MTKASLIYTEDAQRYYKTTKHQLSLGIISQITKNIR